MCPPQSDPTPCHVRTTGSFMERSRVTVHLGRIAQNLSIIRDRLGPGIGILPVVKSDAYGHGMIPVSKALSAEKVEGFAVMSPSEGASLRSSGIAGRILLLSGFFPGEWESLSSCQLTPVIHHLDQLASIPERGHGPRIPVHLKFDTGMGRLGFLGKEVAEVIRLLQKRPFLSVEGVMTHFPSGEKTSETDDAWSKLVRPLVTLEEEGLLAERFVVHAANSAAIVSGGWRARMPGMPASLAKKIVYWVRPGLLLYGIDEQEGNQWGLTGCMEVESRLIAVRDLPAGSGISYGSTVHLEKRTTVGVLGMGYADGLSRLLSSRGWGYASGHRLGFLGRVCMDMVMVDLGPAASFRLGDWITVLGNGRSGPMSASDIARMAGTIPYEVLCLLGRRSPRLYCEEETKGSPADESS